MSLLSESDETVLQLQSIGLHLSFAARKLLNWGHSQIYQLKLVSNIVLYCQLPYPVILLLAFVYLLQQLVKLQRCYKLSHCRWLVACLMLFDVFIRVTL